MPHAAAWGRRVSVATDSAVPDAPCHSLTVPSSDAEAVRPGDARACASARILQREESGQYHEYHENKECVSLVPMAMVFVGIGHVMPRVHVELIETAIVVPDRDERLGTL